MTRRERLEARAERRREWADARAARSDAAHARVHAIADGIPFGQPVLCGHHSERRARADIRRMETGMRESVESSKMAERHADAADGIERALASSIFSDDHDAVEQLHAKIAKLEAERDRMKQANADYRREHGAELKTMTTWERSHAIPYASYSLTNLGARIREAKQRIPRIEREQAARDAGVRLGGRVMSARYGGTCADCGQDIAKGDQMTWYSSTREAVHVHCPVPEA